MGGHNLRLHLPMLGLGTGPRSFAQLMKVPITTSRILNLRLIIYLDDTLIMARTLEEAISHLDMVIYLLEHLGILINNKVSHDSMYYHGILRIYNKIEGQGQLPYQRRR